MSDYLWKKMVWKPFEQKYFIQSILEAQKICIFFGRILLRTAIEKQLKAPISGGMLQDVIFSRYVSERGLWELIRKFKLINNKILDSLEKFNTLRNRFTHDFLYSLVNEENIKNIKELMKLPQEEDIKSALLEMEYNYKIISEELEKINKM